VGCAGLRAGYEPDVARADWTYEVPPAGADAAGLEEYVLEDASGESIGKVQTVLRHGDDLYVAVERGQPPARHDVRVVPWSDVADVDHSALRVRLAVSKAEVDQALELDPDKGVEGGAAEALRVADPPKREAHSPRPVSSGPMDTSAYLASLWLAGLGVFAVFGIVVFATRYPFSWEYALFAVPLALLAVAGFAGYGTFRRPYARR
jgi:hypothetical protein